MTKNISEDSIDLRKEIDWRNWVTEKANLMEFLKTWRNDCCESERMCLREDCDRAFKIIREMVNEYFFRHRPVEQWEIDRDRMYEGEEPWADPDR